MVSKLDEALRALNDAAYAAAKIARQEADGRAADLKSIALKTDDLVNGRVSPPPVTAPVPAAFASGA